MSQMFTYTEDMPYMSPAQNKANFYKLPRSLLLPPYLAHNPYFVDFTDQVDVVFDETIEKPAYALANVRNMWTASKGTQATINANQMIDITNWGGADRGTVANQVTTLGLQFATAEALSDNSYRVISKYLGQYWYGKGLQSSTDFMNFCMGTNMSLVPLWTQDYGANSDYSTAFIPQSSIPPGSTLLTTMGSTSLAEEMAAVPFYPQVSHSTVGGWVRPPLAYDQVGGSLEQVTVPFYTGGGTYPVPVTFSSPWYPTTHVIIELPYGSTVSALTVRDFFYEIANYNLVLYAIDVFVPLPVTTVYVGAASFYQNTIRVRSPHYSL